jgi:hypothetical protein
MNNIVNLNYLEQVTTIPSFEVLESRAASISPIVEIIEEIRQGRMVVLLDDEWRLNL